MYVTIQQATKLTGKSRATISRHISSGKLSKTDEGIDIAELIRVYGELINTLYASDDASDDDSIMTRERWLMSQIDALQQQLAMQKAEYTEREGKLFAMLTQQTEPQPLKSLLFERLFNRGK
jgi:hypothetical protein